MVLREAARTQTERPSVLACVWLLLYTGAWLNEILTLRWEYLDWQHGVAHLPDSKTGAKPLLLTPPALEVLRSMPREHGSPWCLPGRRRGQPLVNPHKPWNRLRAQAGLEGVRLHDLRHTWVSTGLRLGLPIELLGRVLGHKHVATTQGYAHIDTDLLPTIAASVAERLQQALGG
jgi:integrase